MTASCGIGREAWTGMTRMYDDGGPGLRSGFGTTGCDTPPHSAPVAQTQAHDPAREAVWCALSDLYLDTDPALFHDAAARTLAASPYDAATLRAILIDEVHPAFAFNLIDIAGVWEGFDPDWVRERVHTVRARPRWRRALWAGMRGYAHEQWAALAPKIAALRADASPHPVA